MLILACILKVRFFPSFFLLFMKETDIGRYVNGLRTPSAEVRRLVK